MNDHFLNWYAITWAARRELLSRPHSQRLTIARLCWHYCQPGRPSAGDDFQCRYAQPRACQCPCHYVGKQ